MEDLIEVDEVRLEATRDIVEKEITADWQRRVLEDPSLKGFEPMEFTEEEAKKLNPEMVERERAYLRNNQIEFYLKNFCTHLPGGILRVNVGKSGHLDNYSLDEGYRPNSPIRREQTWGEFFQVMDQAIEGEGVTEEVLIKFQKRDWPDINERLKLKETQLAIFVRLRAMGYQNQDLGA